MKTLKEIASRKAELRTMLEDPKADLVAIEKELRELNEMQNQIETRERLIKEAGEINAGKAGEKRETFIPGVKKEVVEEREDKYSTLEYRKAFMNYARTGVISEELRADSTTMTTDIGAVIPTTIMNEVVQKLKSYGQIYSRIRKTAFKGGVKIPTASVKPKATWKSEGTLSEKQKKEIKTYIEFSYYKLQCRVATSLEADTVSLPVFEATIASDMAEAIVVAIEISVIKGDGVGEPKGILAHTTEIPEAQQITISSTDIGKWDKWKKNVFAKIPLAYEGNGIWIMTKATFEGYIDGMVDNNGQPIARTNYGITGSPVRRFGGYDVLCVEADYLPNYENAEADAVFALFVDLNEYIFNSNLQMTMKRYFDENTDEWIDKATLIGDGKLRDANGVLLIKKGA
ncbi:phage major capsid protein [Clostridium beijerinckii]|uniref:HK97 family phage major capsid protein n=1 Tax=Clostridium beijerinckii TaxID=1520 RepID=A0A1S8QLC9_CLOBE|nr:phage major capsid protein [Clostridium beijerinckii]AQS03517.1 phage capsid family protein [Clostridium beijerinckii]MBA2884773.1 HK97 family phage major capsid protein [Clostridium beijerinckii]MBA2899495.1 HK97 family phage major capsid protein [Clostridium beijerinckii]MBA2909124.1 HK97 family phage major capsid protein [Clostridium beijerinckii]MBA9016941.1 HK97 family phage major capsid protein [Clostridium beijerinckii]